MRSLCLLHPRALIAICILALVASCVPAQSASSVPVTPLEPGWSTAMSVEITSTSIADAVPSATLPAPQTECSSNKVLFLHTLHGGKTSLFLACLDDSRVSFTQQVFDGEVGLYGFSASPNGSLVIEDADNNVTYIQQYPSGRQETAFGATDNVTGFSWSPDSQYISYVRSDNNGVAVEILHVASHTISRVFNAGVGDTTSLLPIATAWSPDGKKIAAKTDWAGGIYVHVINVKCNSQKHTCDSDGVQEIPITEPFIRAWKQPWATDSAHLLLSCGEKLRQFCMIDLNGKVVTRYDISKLGFEIVGQPALSPDGKMIAFSGSRSSNEGLGIFGFQLDTNATFEIDVENNADGEGPLWGYPSP